MENLIKKLEKLLKIKSPSGNTEEAMAFIEKEFISLNIATKRTNKGALIATIEGKNKDKEVTLSAHVDTLGAMVKNIKENGRISFSQIGGYTFDSVEGEYIELETLKNKTYSGTILTKKSSPHVHGQESSSLKRNQENMEIRLDEKVASKDDVEKLGINVGDFVHLDPRVHITKSGFIKSRHLDDKAGVIALLGIAEKIVKSKVIPNYTCNFFISNYEEVGHGASCGIPEKTFEFLAVDMAAVGKGQASDEFSVTICAKDSSGPYDYDFRKRLIELCKLNNIDYKIDIYPFYSSDASAALRAGYDFKAALIGPGVDSSHSYERTHMDAVENTIKLGFSYLTD